MEVLILIALGAWFLIWRWRRRARAAHAFAQLDQATPFLAAQGFDPATINFTTYKQNWVPGLSETSVLVGYGNLSGGEKAGFLVEVAPGLGVMEYHRLSPTLASHHSSVATDARLHGLPMAVAFMSRREPQ